MKKSELRKMIREEMGLTLPDGTINGDPKGDEDTEPTLPMYKEKEKNIAEGSTTMDFSGIKFLVLLNIKPDGGRIQLIPKTTKDLDKLDVYGKERAIKFLRKKVEQSLRGISIWEISDGSAGINFKFSIGDLETILANKIK